MLTEIIDRHGDDIMPSRKIEVTSLASVSDLAPGVVTSLRENYLGNSLVLSPINNPQAEAPHPILLARSGDGSFSLLMDRPGHSWCLSCENPKAAASIARQLHAEGRVGHYLHAEAAIAKSVVAAWTWAGGTVARLAFRFAVMAGRNLPVQDSVRSDGHVDYPTIDELPVLAERSWSFYRNTMHEHATLSSQRVWIAAAIKQGGMKVWRKDGRIMAQGAFPDPAKVATDHVNFSMVTTDPSLSFNDQAKYAKLLLSAALGQPQTNKTFYTYADARNPLHLKVYSALGLTRQATILRYDGLYPAGKQAHERFSYFHGA